MANTSAIQIILAYALEHNSGQEAAILDRRQPTKLCAHIPGNAPFDPAAQRATQAMCARAAQLSYSRVRHNRRGLPQPVGCGGPYQPFSGFLSLVGV